MTSEWIITTVQLQYKGLGYFTRTTKLELFYDFAFNYAAFPNPQKKMKELAEL